MGAEGVHLSDGSLLRRPAIVRFTDQRPPDELVQSVRAIPLAGHGVVVCRLADGTAFLPGGTREEGESVDECMSRELVEEAGFLMKGRPHWFAAHSGVSYHRVPYRPHAPFPLKAWLWGAVEGELAGPPTNPAGAEQVTSVSVLRPQDAVALLENEGRGYAQALRHWMISGAPVEF
ncbi:NUDIX domain-containing protein [Streptomyces antarcticus]|uniref:NUDIX domain-containing protein n=1 Tax=Streptomyces antarcticus TaxID=2996458 RepID=UPI00226E6EC5|nr:MULTISPECIES: NUDIX domain-containing protein [unclassified Streptomyces]MCY0943361.1 NUDIX domain-containing protein [Streptomyces sp. H34-AA3]MCY0951349.1 NUDIX domain-containing protein [Streptomyces sp. H27-S2]MCZ4085331.1 NUDIX domain-containing protein [Streptomyces sp. H34-S5]